MQIKNKDWNFIQDEKESLRFTKDIATITDNKILEKVKSPEVSSIFREYDLRGNIDVFDEDMVKALSYALTVLIHKQESNNKKIIVSSDNEDYNISSKEIAKQIFLDAGLTVYDAGVTSSPAVFFAQQHYKCDSIASFTASHNPYGDKGMKTGIVDYSTFGPAGIEILREQFLRCEYVEKQEGKLITIDHDELIDAYADMIRSKGIDVKGNHIIINTLNATGSINKKILERLGLKVIGINLEQVGSKPGDPQKNPELEQVKKETQMILKKEIERLKKDIDTKNIFALAFDRDADRMVPVGQEKTCSADELAILAFRQKIANMKSKGSTEAVAVCDLKSSMAVFEDPELKEHGLTCLPWYTGHSYIKQYMRHLMKEGIRVIGGAEKSGHQFQEGCYDEPLEDAMLLLQYLNNNRMTLEEALETITPYELGPSTKAYLDPSKFDPSTQTLKDRKYEIMQEIIRIINSHKEIANDRFRITEVVDLGLNLRVFFRNDDDEGNFVLRPSSNEEVFTINIEIKKKEPGEDKKKEIFLIQNYIAFDVLAANFVECTTVKNRKGEKVGLLNKMEVQDLSERDYLKESEDWTQTGPEEFTHKDGNKVSI